MTATLEEARLTSKYAVEQLFKAHPRIQSVGITRVGQDYQFRAVRTAEPQGNAVLLQSAAFTLPSQIENIYIEYVTAPGHARSQIIVAAVGPSSPAATSSIPEVNKHRPLVSGLQIQNVDDDLRQVATGAMPTGNINVGTLGCLVTLAAGGMALLSNNHVIAGSNRGHKHGNRADRILQSGKAAFDAAEHIAKLSDFVTLNASPTGATPGAGNVFYNSVDAAIAKLNSGVQYSAGYLPYHGKATPMGTATAFPGDSVFKVGRTTGLTEGIVTAIGVVVGPIAYDCGLCWFQDAIEIEGIRGTLFSDTGDSGSVIVNDRNQIVAMLFAGNGRQSYACSIADALSSLNCVYP